MDEFKWTIKLASPWPHVDATLQPTKKKTTTGTGEQRVLWLNTPGGWSWRMENAPVEKCKSTEEWPTERAPCVTAYTCVCVWGGGVYSACVHALCLWYVRVCVTQAAISQHPNETGLAAMEAWSDWAECQLPILQPAHVTGGEDRLTAASPPPQKHCVSLRCSATKHRVTPATLWGQGRNRNPQRLESRTQNLICLQDCPFFVFDWHCTVACATFPHKFLFFLQHKLTSADEIRDKQPRPINSKTGSQNRFLKRSLSSNTSVFRKLSWRVWHLPHCYVVPFNGSFLRETFLFF